MKNRKNLWWGMSLILGLLVAQWGCGGAKMSEDAAVKRLQKGFQQQEKGNSAEAMRIYTEVIEKMPQFSTGYVYRAMLHESMGENDKAIADFQKVIERDPTDFYCAQQIANIYRKMGDTAKAKEADLQAQKIQQNSMQQTRKNLNKGKKHSESRT